MLARRYRIVGLLGRGGMGEVYRADDLKLGRPVALKLLPENVERDPGRLERFLNEVRLAVQVTHPNVCRVFDIGEVDGRHYLSMEYVDGEDLASLLRRIGRLPQDKAIEIARQLCAGITAAHEEGILHRDLKPANVMLDGRGRAKITDFGLAGATLGIEGIEARAGTPGYMAPEQLAGEKLTPRTDIYALGLVLYELFTGKAAFEAATATELERKKSDTAPSSPSSHVDNLDPAVERTILRCLEPDPKRRPDSALAVAAALPGGDPLAAALAAGETPSPEMVAAAGGEGALSARRAWTMLTATLLAIAAIVVVSPSSTDLGLSKLSKSADVLRARAQDIAIKNGYDADPLDSGGWFFRFYDPLIYKAQNTPSTEWRREMSEGFSPIGFHYRQSPQWMPSFGSDGLALTDPPFEVSGMVNVSIDARGRLLVLRGMPPQLVNAAVDRTEPDWAPLFTEAGLDLSSFTEKSPRWVPPVAFDTHREWEGEAPWAPGVPLEVTTASFAGTPVSFEVHGPWSRPTRMTGPRQNRGSVSRSIFSFLSLLALVTAIFFAWRNIQLGRGDHRGAIRIGAFFALLSMGRWVFGAHHIGGTQEMAMLFVALITSIGVGVLLLGVYLAVEPYVRRRTPGLLIGWARTLEGRFRDPQVGHDLLAGVLFGAVLSLAFHVSNGLPTWFSFPGQTTLRPSFEALAGGRKVVAFLLESVSAGVVPGLGLFAMYGLLRIVLRKPVIAMVVLGSCLFLFFMGGENPVLELPTAAFAAALVVVAISRFGLLSNVVLWTALQLFIYLPLPPVPGAPYFATSLLLLFLILALVMYAFRISLGTRPVFGTIDH